MRRCDREITDKRMIEEFIAGEQILRIAFNDGGDIYIVPVNYGYLLENENYVFYFHGAKAGRKYELAKLNPSVGFEIDGKFSLMTGEAACDYSAHFQSVIGTGRLSLILEKEEKILGLNALMKQTTQHAEWKYSEELLRETAVFRLDVNRMSCKAK
ncbi:MAG: pyridoxamine 5'-phosphate oxidase family protein [Lachnospiraceae bacterium]|nr:pyridoxamine 5'-phosphate oxidase family protein [Lachnospiraceae bacterium]